MNAYLIMENGAVFEGQSPHPVAERICETVFHTAMAGFTEILTDPRSMGQALVLSYPLIGNVGICQKDYESGRLQAGALIVSELSEIFSNFRADASFEPVLKDEDIPCITGVDTRSLVRLLREEGPMRALITTNPEYAASPKGALAQIAAWQPSCELPCFGRAGKTPGPDKGKTIALVDTGARNSTVEALTRRGARVKIYAPDTPVGRILAEGPGGLLLAEGPGDPNGYPALIEIAKAFMDSSLPLMALGLGHQLLALANGARVIKLPCGHRGANIPVRDQQAGTTAITSQNHGYAVQEESLDPAICTVSHRNVNDGTVEGLQYSRRNTISLQFAPDAFGMEKIYDEFLNM